MSYRDTLDAAQARARSLAEEVGKLSQQSDASAQELAQVRSQLAEAEKEVSRLAALVPGSPAQKAGPYRAVLLVGVGLVVATAIAGYHSESIGVAMSCAAAPALGFGGSGWLAARLGRAPLVPAILGALALGLALAGFYAVVWPEL
ncbi:MAG: hypothetical protein IT378_15250 [Sandaracinaceae bacterium]|nr:hypothetical protein [Sandaracinaceae bacterium]